MRFVRPDLCTIEYSPSYDAFHPSYSAFTGLGHTSRSHASALRMGIFDLLPQELIAHILELLDPIALDAIRCTCSSFWETIMDDASVLAKVLNQDVRIGIRRLAALLDHRVKVGLVYGRRQKSQQPAIRAISQEHNVPHELSPTYFDRQPRNHWWRTRFRRHTIHFEAQNTTAPKAKIQAIEWIVRPRILGLHVYDDQRGSKIVCYYINFQNIPIHIGTIDLPISTQDAKVLWVDEIPDGKGWILEIGVSPPVMTRNVITIEARGSYGHTESPYNVRLIDPETYSYHSPWLDRLLSSPGHHQQHTEDEWPDDTRKWRFLDRFQFPPEMIPPLSTTAKERLFYHHNPLRVPNIKFHKFFMAQHVQSSELYIVRTPKCPTYESAEAGDQDDHWTFRDVVQLQKPARDALLRNIAALPELVDDYQQQRIVRVAAIWESDDSSDIYRRELYVYEIPWSWLWRVCLSSTYYNSANAQSSEPRLSDPSLSDYDDALYFIAGRRITSLPAAVGGAHNRLIDSGQKSDRPSSRPENRYRSGLAFASLPMSTSLQQSIIDPFSKLYVWGPADPEEAGRITLDIFEMSLADASRLHCSNSILSSDMASTISRTLGLRISQTYVVGSIMHNCACALHDETWEVILPLASECPSNSRSLKPLVRFYPSSTKKSTQHGTVTRMKTAEYIAARNREAEYFKQKIVAMKRFELTDIEVSHAWLNVPWTAYGAVRQPKDWARSWKEWDEDREINRPSTPQS